MSEIIESSGRIVAERTPEIIAAEIKTIEENVCRTALNGAVEIGYRLQEIKESLGHGGWYKFIKENLGYSERQAQNFMKIATEYGSENSPYFEAISNPHTCADLSISKALKLLQVPEEAVEKFVENNPINDMTVKELEAEIKKLKEEKTEIEELSDEQQEKLEALESDIETLNKELDEAMKKTSDVPPEEIVKLNDVIKGKEIEIENKEKEIDKIKRSLNNAQKKIEAANAESEKKIAEAQEAAKAEAEKLITEKVEKEIEQLKAEAEAAKERAAKAEAKAEVASNEAIIKIKLIADDLQNILQKAAVTLSEIEPETAEKLKAALKQIISAYEL